MNWKIVRNTCLFFVILHTIYVGGVFYYIHTHPRPQDYLYWSKFVGLMDKPLVNLGFALDRKINLLGSLTYWWHTQGFSGHNLRHGIMHLIFGGLQWGLLGVAFGMIRSLKKSLKKKASYEIPKIDKDEIHRAYRVLHQRGISGQTSQGQFQFLNGVNMYDQKSGLNDSEPSPAVSRFLETESGGFVVAEQGVTYFLKVHIRERPKEALRIKIECDNPMDGSKPFTYMQDFPPETEDFLFSSPAFVKGLQGHATYTINVFIFKNRSERDPIDELVQKVKAYVDTTTDQIKIVK